MDIVIKEARPGSSGSRFVLTRDGAGVIAGAIGIAVIALSALMVFVK